MPRTGKDQLADGYAAVLDEVSQCVRAVRDGDWQYLAARAESLSTAAAELSELARNSDEAMTGDVDVVLARVAASAGAVEVMTALHSGRTAEGPASAQVGLRSGPPSRRFVSLRVAEG